MLSTWAFVLKFHTAKIFSNRKVQNFLPYLYIFDSVAALFLSLAIYLENYILFIVSMTFLCNFFLLHILHRVFNAKKPDGMLDELVATTKSYIHHCASFLFLDSNDYEVLLITAIWRAVSMSGHTAQVLGLKKVITTDELNRFNWFLSHVRNIIVLIILVLCFIFPKIRNSFGKSAIGHVGYILVRAGPVFRLGSVYVGDRPLWQSFTDYKRIQTLMSGKHPYLSLECGSLTFLALLFLSWRYIS
eukprot:gene11663-15615_t